MPTEMLGRTDLAWRAYNRGGLSEFRFYYRDPRPKLPIIRDGRFQFVRWGNGRGQSRYLPRSGWTWISTIRSGGWRESGAIFVDIPATYGWQGGVWYLIEQGIRGLLVPDERGKAVVYLVCEPASHYYQVMTRSYRMPVLLDQRI